MRNIYAINAADEVTDHDGVAAFLRDKVPVYQEEQLDASEKKAEALVEKAKLPLFWRGMFWVLGLAAFFCLRLFASLADETTVWGLLVAGLLCLVGFSLVAWAQFRRTKRTLESDEVQVELDAMGQTMENSRRILGVPEDAADLDCLGYVYKLKRGKEKIIYKGVVQYVAVCPWVFMEEGELMLADSSNKLAIPLSAITGITVRRKRTRVLSWNKDEAPKSATYKPYKIAYNEDDDEFIVRAVYTLTILGGGEEYQLLVPDYDWELVLWPLLAPHLPADIVKEE